MARIQLKIWHAPLSVLSSPPPVGLAEGEVAIAIETNTFVKRPDGDDTGALISLTGDTNFVRARAATTGNITLAGLQTIDGVFLNAGDVVLVKNQNDPRDNGVYVAAVGVWLRYLRAATVMNLASMMAVVEAGLINNDTLWICTVDRDGNDVGTAPIFFSQPVSPAAGGGSNSEVVTISFPSGSGGIMENENGIVISSLTGVMLEAPKLRMRAKDDTSALPDLFNVGNDGRLSSRMYGNLDEYFGRVNSVNGKSGRDLTLTAADVGGISLAQVGAVNGVAALGADGKVPASQLPTMSNENASSAVSFGVTFTGTDPTAVSGLPTGWTATISGTTITISHNKAKMPVGISYYGYNTGSGTPTWRYRMPTAANEMLVIDATKTSSFSFVLNTSICAADLGGKAQVNVQF